MIQLLRTGLTLSLSMLILSGCTKLGSSQLIGHSSSSSFKLQSAKSTADQGYNDLMVNYWQTDHIIDTQEGFRSPNDVANSGGSASYIAGVQAEGWGLRPTMWNREYFWAVVYEHYKETNDQSMVAMANGEWNHLKSIYGNLKNPALMVTCNTYPVNAEDDAGWIAREYLQIYQISGNYDAYVAAVQMVNCAYGYFADPAGHGMTYSKTIHHSSVYETLLMTTAYEIYKISGDTSFRDKAMSTYNWIQRDMVQSNSLYMQEMDLNTGAFWPQPDMSTITNPVQSGTFLLGNTGMALMSARLYADTGDDQYLQNAVATSNAIGANLDQYGLLIPDKDPGSDGVFIAEWARQVLVLPGVHYAVIRKALVNTAASIAQADRTSDGRYGADWNGDGTWLATGANNALGMGLTQITTAGAAVSVMQAAYVANNTTPAATSATSSSDGSADASSTLQAPLTSNPTQVDATAVAQVAADAAAQAASDAAAQAAAQANAQADAQAAAQAAAQAQAQSEAQMRAAAAQAAQAAQAAVAAAAAQSASDAQAAAAQAFAARQTQPVYRYVGPQGGHLFALTSDGSGLPANATLEGAVFSVYVVHYASTHAIYRCNTAGHQFISEDSGCEGQTFKGLLGFVGDAQIANLQPLYRMNNNGDYLEATSTDEGTGAGYTVEGVLGYAP